MAEITSLYHQSELNNLRILQQTMWDFERVFRVLAEKHRKCDHGLIVLLRLFFVFSFELKAGRIVAEDLRLRANKIVAGMMAQRDKGPLTPLLQASSRYPEIRLEDTILSDDLLNDILARGVVEETAIQSSLDQSGYFGEKENEPAWRILWHAFERADDDVAVAFNEVERQFAAREFKISGEMLHVFGLRLWAARIGALNKSASDVVAECRSYIDDLYAQGALEPSPRDDLSEIRFGGYGGLGMHEHKSAEFRELFQYLRHRQQIADEDRYPAQGAVLVVEMVNDADLFFRRVCATNSPDNIYARVPILSAIDPNQFVSSLLNLHPANQRTVFLALKSRYEHGQLAGDLKDEVAWLKRVCENLMEAAKTMAPFPKERLLSIVRYTLEPILPKDNKAPSNSA